jgi:ribosomal protein S18 acetylase RimI-like enzyme
MVPPGRAHLIREMRQGEAAGVRALLLECNEENLARFPKDVARGYRAELGAGVGRIPGSVVLVAESAGAIVGTATLLTDAAHDDHSWPPGGAVLRLLAVTPRARGRGIARALTGECIDRARDAGAAFVGLHTSAVMEAAQALYTTLGFERTPEHDFEPGAHYGARIDGGEPSPTMHGGERWGLAYVLKLEGEG